METSKDKIKRLEEEIREIKESEKKKLTEKYQYLIGKCLHRGHTSYEKITSICRVDVDQYGDEIVFDCIDVYYDDRGDEYNLDAHISLNSYRSLKIEDINERLISVDRFNEAFESCVDTMRRLKENHASCALIKKHKGGKNDNR